MSIYRNRSVEEIHGLLQTFPEAYQEKFGQPLNKDLLLAWLRDLRAQKVLEHFQSAFSSMSPQTLDLFMDEVQKYDFKKGEYISDKPPVKEELVESQPQEKTINKKKR